MTRSREGQPSTGPLRDVLVVDVSRMLPGAVLARTLLDLGARLIKVEEPEAGDPMRSAPPLLDGIGAGFCSFYRGAESLCLDLRDPSGAAKLVSLASHADVLVESFRPGTLEAWSVGPERFAAVNPGLIGCSLSGFGSRGPHHGRVGHDLNFVALTGLMSFLPGTDVPRVQIADISAGVLACNAILAALLERFRNGRGTWIDQPLISGPLPFLTWATADAAAGGGSHGEELLGGSCPAYRFYTCGDGKRIAVCALEPKFWVAFVESLGLPELADCGLETGPDGNETARLVEERLATRSREHWLHAVGEGNLPVTPVYDLDETMGDRTLHETGLLEETPVPGGQSLTMIGPFLPALGATPSRAAPRLGEHTDRLIQEFVLES